MILFPPAKINLGLNVKHKRDDGYHEIETCMVPISLTDVLEILPSDQFLFTQTGITVAGEQEENLCVRAFRLLQSEFDLPNVYIHLRKNIPMGAGLGGGSADATYVLLGLNDLFSLGLSHAQLEQFAARLGSDCPFFVKNEAQIAKGRGELLEPCGIDLSGYYLYLINPGIHVGTAEAYAGITFSSENVPLAQRVTVPIEEWKTVLKNDFETQIFVRHPEIAQIKEALYEEGAIYAAMSGSGSSVFGIFKERPYQRFSDYFEFVALLP